MTTDRTETLLHLVIAAFWVTAWGFMAAVGLTDWRLWTTLVLHGTFGVLRRRVIGQGHSLARFRSTVRWQTAIIVVGLLIQPDTFAILSPAVAMLAAMRLPRREGIAWTSVLGVLNLGSQINNNPSATGFFDGLIQGVIILAFAAFAHSLVQAKAARKQTQTVLADLQSAHSRLREYADQVEELARREPQIQELLPHRRGHLALLNHDVVLEIIQQAQGVHVLAGHLVARILPAHRGRQHANSQGTRREGENTAEIETVVHGFLLTEGGSARQSWIPGHEPGQKGREHPPWGHSIRPHEPPGCTTNTPLGRCTRIAGAAIRLAIYRTHTSPVNTRPIQPPYFRPATPARVVPEPGLAGRTPG